VPWQKAPPHFSCRPPLSIGRLLSDLPGAFSSSGGYSVFKSAAIAAGPVQFLSALMAVAGCWWLSPWPWHFIGSRNPLYTTTFCSTAECASMELITLANLVWQQHTSRGPAWQQGWSTCIWTAGNGSLELRILL